MIPTPGWIEIDLEAIAHNLDSIRASIPAPTEVCIVLKADAYGHGIEHVLPLVMERGFEIIGITGNEEALAARYLGYTGRIIRIRPALAEEVEEALVHEVEEWVGGPAHAAVVARVGRANRTRVPVHLSINSTGLSRDGVDLSAADGDAAVEAVLAHPELAIAGICSHFPAEDVDDVEAGAAAFAEQSAAVAALLARTGRPRATRHCATSFAALKVEASRFDLVRIGAAVYGDTSADSDLLRPAFSLKSRIAAVNRYPAGSSVGYDRTHRLTADAVLATVPLGYADGIQRSMGGRGHALVHGRRVPIVDRHAMNTLTLDVSAVHGVRPGDEVVFFGSQGAERITAADLEVSNGHLAAELYSVWGRLHTRITLAASPVAAAV